MNPNRSYAPRAGTPERPLSRKERRELARHGLILPGYIRPLSFETLESKRSVMNRVVINQGISMN